MRAPLKSRRPSPEEALAIATSTAPEQPPAVFVSSGIDAPTTLNLRVRTSTIAALTEAAKERGLTMKQVVCHALQAADVIVAVADLEDRTPRRK
jgi:hypothetical protein